MYFDLVTVVWGIDDAVNDKADEEDEENDSWVGGLGEIENLSTFGQWQHWGHHLDVHLDEISIDQSLDLVAGDLIEWVD